MMTCLYRFMKDYNKPYITLIRDKDTKEFLQGYPSIYTALMIALKNEVINEVYPELILTLYYHYEKDKNLSKASYIYCGDNTHYCELECNEAASIFAKCGYGEYIIRYKKPVPGAEGVFAFYTCTLNDGTPEETEFDPTKMVCGLPTAFSFIKHI